MELGFVYAALRKRWGIVLLFAAVAVLAVVWLSTTAETTYTSRSTVAVSAPSGAQPDRFVADQVVLMRSTAIRNPVAERLGVDSQYLSVHVSIVAQAGTNFINVIAEDPDPDRSVETAGAYVETYEEFSKNAAVLRTQPLITSLNDRLQAVEVELQELANEYAAAVQAFVDAGGTTSGLPPASALAPRVEGRRSAKQAEYDQLLAARNSIEFQANGPAVELVDVASPPVASETGPATLNLVAGLLVGLALGAATAVLLSRFSSFALDAKAVGDELGVPVVGALKLERAAHVGPSYLRDQPTNLNAEVLDVVSARAQTSAAGSVLWVTVTAAQRDVGMTALTLVLANTFRRHHDRVLIIDADHRRPELAQMFAARPGSQLAARGIAEGAQEEPAGWISVLSTGEPGIDVLRLADGQPRRREAVADLVSWVNTWAEVVIVDAGPAIGSASAVQFSAVSDCVVIAVDDRRQRLAGLRELRRELSGLGSTLLPVAVRLRRGRLGGQRRLEGVDEPMHTTRSTRSVPERTAEVAEVDSTRMVRG